MLVVGFGSLPVGNAQHDLVLGPERRLMNFLDDVKKKVGRLVVTAKDEHAARQERPESDVAADANVAGSRANVDGDDGSYVGRTSPQFDADIQESGAEARSEATRRPRKES